MSHSVVRRNSRLHIVNNDTGEIVYTPPDFLRVDTKKALLALATHLDLGKSRIGAIIDFESKTEKRNKKWPTFQMC